MDNSKKILTDESLINVSGGANSEIYMRGDYIEFKVKHIVKKPFATVKYTYKTGEVISYKDGVYSVYSDGEIEFIDEKYVVRKIDKPQ